MKKIKKAQNRFTTERTESMMFMTLFAEEAIRYKAIAELRNRRNEQHPETMPKFYNTNLGIVSS